MERTEFSREATRLDREFQYLRERDAVNICTCAKMKVDKTHLSLIDTLCLLIFTLLPLFPLNLRSYILRTFSNTIAAIVFLCPVLQ